MFEQATLMNAPAGKRVWTTFLGVTSQVALVSLAMLAPMLWPQTLPVAHFWESLTATVPPGPKPPGDLTPKHSIRADRPTETFSPTTYQPHTIPDHVDMTYVDPAPEFTVVGAPTGSGASGSNAEGFIGSLLRTNATNTNLMPHLPALEKPVEKPAADKPPVVQRLQAGGLVSLGRPLSKIDPQYPPAARIAHVSGDVLLECVVGTDGHIREVKVKSGSPLLVRAAVAAIWNWVYEPTRLNDVPIEVVTVITVSFKLN